MAEISRSKNGESLLPRLKGQLTQFTLTLKDIHSGRERSLLKDRGMDFIHKFYLTFIGERNSRANEVESEDVQKAVEIASHLFGNPIFGVMCIDGRVLPTLFGGFPAKFGGFLRVPAGDLPEFVQGKHNGLTLLENSNFHRRLDDAFQKNNTVIQILDSHVACAAREKETKGRGEESNDHGLLRDVMRKREIAQAMIQHTETRHPSKTVIPIQFSFDPHNGYGYMGLEKTNAVAYASQNGGFTPEVIKTLVGQSNRTYGVISTEELAHGPGVEHVFRQHAFEINWKYNYGPSAIQFWTAIDRMRDTLLPLIRDRVCAIYPEKHDDREIEIRALLLLTNAFSGYLLNQKSYEFNTHNEQCVVVSEGGYGPFATASFAVFSRARAQLATNVDFAASIVRDNRGAGRIHDQTANFGNEKSFKKAPVPVIVEEIVRGELTDKDWEKIRAIDFSDLPSMQYRGADWRTMTKHEFSVYINSKDPSIEWRVVEALNTLRERMAILYNPEQSTAAQLIDGAIVALPVLADAERRIQAIVPFILSGY